MEFDVIKRSHLKRNIIIGVLVIGIISAVVLNFTKAKYRTTQSIPLVTGTINYSLADLNIVAITVDGSEVDTIPDGNYELTSESYCTVNGEKDSSIKLSYDSNTKALSVTPMTTKGTKCYLDFEHSLLAKDVVMANREVNNGTPDFSKTSCAANTNYCYYEDNDEPCNCEDDTNGLFTSEDNTGTSYYFRGTIKDNWIKLGKYFWRIIRINGDGTIRMIYTGTGDTVGSLNNVIVNSDGSIATGSGTMMAQSVFNSSKNGYYFVGWEYTQNQLHGRGSFSTIKNYLQDWYNNNLQVYDQFIASGSGASFCNDRILNENLSVNGLYYYGAQERLIMNSIPSLKCSDENDIFNDKIGLISIDEAVMAGAAQWNLNGRNNYGYYLYNGSDYWTISPLFYNGNASVFSISNNGNYLNPNYIIDVSYKLGVRAVINLRSDVQLTGSGTIIDPYVVVGAD